jgi:predicted nucleic acid-binding protein
MYLLDTNVLSELRKVKTGQADPAVAAWAKRTPADNLFPSCITVLELQIGLLLIERRDAVLGTLLRHWLHHQILPAFAMRILPADTSVALRCVTLHVPDPQTERDALVALVHGFIVVARNVADFQATGVLFFNPWQQ